MGLVALRWGWRVGGSLTTIHEYVMLRHAKHLLRAHPEPILGQHSTTGGKAQTAVTTRQDSSLRLGMTDEIPTSDFRPL